MADSIFTKIINKEAASWTVYEDDKAIAILDIHPVNPGHVLVVPRDVYANIFELPEELFAHLMLVAKRMADAVKKATNADGINILMNNGPAAGQFIEDHSHIHIIPRFIGDGFTDWHGHGTYAEGQADEMAEKVKNAALTA